MLVLALVVAVVVSTSAKTGDQEAREVPDLTSRGLFRLEFCHQCRRGPLAWGAWHRCEYGSQLV